MTIRVHMWPIENTRTPEKSCYYAATCVIGDVPYAARSRNGALNELARVLVAAGVPDAPMVVTHRGLGGEATCRSFHEAAMWTYIETATVSLHRVRWEDPAIRRARIADAFGKKQGSKDGAGMLVPLAASPA